MNPDNINKYVYVENTQTWVVRTVYAIGIVVWAPVIFLTITLAEKSWFFALFVLPIVIILTIHYYTSFTLNLFYKQFDIKKHNRLVKRFWKAGNNPSVDVYLPICGEEMDILRNTWKYISQLEYPNKEIYVLDDSKEDLDEHRRLAEQYGFHYMSRPNRGEMKKAGNLKYAFERTSGDFIAIFDADFAPRAEYLRELIPYMSDRKVGIVQSPQYFSTDASVHASSPLAYGGARAQEIFYRIIQVARDRIGGTHCCGTCAVYRRTALASIGGFVQMTHSEDAHTGLGIQMGGYAIRYIPLAVSIGISPDDPHAFFHQQHRWCLGNMLMLFSGKFWRAPISWKVKYSYITGFLFYLHQPFVILFSFQLFWILIFYGKFISLSAGLPFYPHVIWAFAYMFLFYISQFRWGYLYAILLRMYAYCHAIATAILGGTVGWIATGSKFAGVSSAYRQTITGLGICILAYIACIGLAVKAGAIHFLDYNYYSLEFWILFNLGLSCMLLWQMYQKMARSQRELVTAGVLEKSSFQNWQLKTAGAYAITAIGIFLFILSPILPLGGSTPDLAIASINLSAPTTTRDAASSTLLHFSINHQVGDVGPDIFALQEFLNDSGFIVSQSGAGSPGHETSYFGLHTKRALIAFQSANHLSASGYLGWQTREFINSQNILAAYPSLPN